MEERLCDKCIHFNGYCPYNLEFAIDEMGKPAETMDEIDDCSMFDEE